MRIPTDRYTSVEFQQREREAIWMRVWQIVGRVDDLPKVGDWKVYQIFDQSFIIVRGKDEQLRGFVNACRHRGNVLCQGTGNAKRGFLCQYHLWSYDLEGKMRGALRERENVITREDKDENGLLQVSVDTFGGFIFLNPDPSAAPLAEFLGPEVAELLAPYHLDQFTTVMDVREAIDCNWKVVMDAFNEGYHISGIHPQLLRVIQIDPSKSRYRFFETHSVAVAPFEVQGASAQQQVDGIMDLPETFPSTVAVLPRFEELVKEYRAADGSVDFPDGVNARTVAAAGHPGHSDRHGPGRQRVDRRADERQPGLGAVPELLHDRSCRRVPRDHGHAPPGRRSQPMHLARQQLHVPSGGTPEMRSAPTRSKSTSREATSISRRCNRITSRCRASRSACATAGSSTCP